jgi:hypothetical protein
MLFLKTENVISEIIVLQLTYKDHGYLLLLKPDIVKGETIFAYVWRFMNGQLSGSQCVKIFIHTTSRHK